MRAQIRSIILNILGSISKPSCHIYILNGHYVKLKESETNALQFESLLSELSTDFDFISFDIACLKIINHEAVARPTIAFTFDDGFKECYTVIAPILEKFATNACFFIDPCVIGTTDNVRREFLRTRLMIYRDKKFMSWNEIADLQKRGHEIGNHTMNHTALTGMSYEENLTEILTGKY